MFISFKRAKIRHALGDTRLLRLIADYNIPIRDGYVLIDNPNGSLFKQKVRKKSKLIDSQALAAALSLDNISPRSYTH